LDGRSSSGLPLCVVILGVLDGTLRARALRGISRQEVDQGTEREIPNAEGRLYAAYYLLVDVSTSYLSFLGLPEGLKSMTLIEKMKCTVVCATIIGGSWNFQWNVVSLMGVTLGLSTPRVRSLIEVSELTNVNCSDN
jgi:hypothetical protein